MSSKSRQRKSTKPPSTNGKSSDNETSDSELRRKPLRQESIPTTFTAGTKKSLSGWQLKDFIDLPGFLQDNEYLLSSHRPELPSVRQCFKSWFSLHTETCNIWTHAIGSVGTMFMCGYYLSQPDVSLAQKIWFSIFFAGAIICMGFSAVYHTMLCYSEKINKSLAKMDYCGIIVLIVASFPPWVNYCFYCHWPTKTVYLILVSLLGLLCVYFVVDEKFASKEFLAIRAALFIALGLTGVFPAGHYLMCNTWNDSVQYLPWLLFMAALYITGGVVYALRIPERWKPGMFDIWCHSHQFLHVFVVGGVISCFCGITKIADHVQHLNCTEIYPC